MDTLRETIHSLSTEERREFRSFINRQRVRKNRKDLALFELLLKDDVLSPREIAARFYPGENMNAYHTLRKRLTQHLQDFISLKIKDQDDSSYAHVAGFISVGRYLLSKNRAQVALKFLQKAEVLAEENELFELLDSLYSLEVKNAHRLGLKVEELIGKWEESRRRREIEERVGMAYGLVQERLAQMRKEGVEEDLEGITQSALDQLAIGSEALERPSLMYMMVAMTRSSLISTKAYYRFEPYVIDAYERLINGPGFRKKDHLYELWFLYMISHVLYRNRKFDKCEDYLEKLREAIDRYGSLHYNTFYPRYVMLRAAMLSYSGQNDEAVALLEENIENPSFKSDVANRLNLLLNLAVYHFQAENYRAANRTLLDIGHTDKWCEKKMGMEWRFKKNLIEIIIQTELGNTEIALTRIKSVDRYFSSFFEQSMYQRARIFMHFIRLVIEKPEEVKTPDFSQKVDDAIVRLPGDQEDIQAMTFYCWLKSKMLGRKYYEVLVETIREF